MDSVRSLSIQNPEMSHMGPIHPQTLCLMTYQQFKEGVARAFGNVQQIANPFSIMHTLKNGLKDAMEVAVST